MMAKRKEKQKLEKITNSFLCSIPDCQIIDMGQLSDAFDLYMRRHKEENKILDGIIEQICRECKLNVKFFLFFDIPDFLIKKTLPKQDLDNAIELLNDAKEEYLRGKAEALKVGYSEVKMTEDDLVPLDILSFVMQKR